MSESKVPYQVESPLAHRLQALAAFEAQKPAVRTAGIEALKRLVPIAQQSHGASDVVARFLLGCYNGQDFPFDLTELRRLDIDLHADCVAVLKMDFTPHREVHQLIEGGDRIFKQLALNYAPSVIQQLKQTIKTLQGFEQP